MTPSDFAERRRALTRLDQTLLVEAAAGTGKTAIIAGRAVALLAAGCDPSEIAAITFTELAAGELGQRIRNFVETLLKGEVPPSLAPAFPDGPSDAQRRALQAAAARLDELTATTIHGFCWDMVKAYAVEAKIDPGASILDARQADALFDDVLVAWLTRRLADAGATNDDPIAVLAADAPLELRRTVRQLAEERRRHPTATTPVPDFASRADISFTEAVREFGAWAAAPPERKTTDILGQLGRLADFFRDAFATAPSYRRLLELSRPRRQGEVMRSHTLVGWKVYAAKTQWARLDAEAGAHYARCQAAFANLMGQIAARLVDGLFRALDEPLADYAAAKQAAAVVDFDDLLLLARRLLRGHEPARQAVGRRFRHILVDEFQDTDPVQAEIIFNIAAATRPEAWLDADLVPGSLFAVGDPKQAIYGFRGADPQMYADVRAALLSRDPESVVRLNDNFRSVAVILDHVNACFETPLERPGQSGYVALHAARPGTSTALSGAMSLTFDTQSTTVDGHREDEAVAVARFCRSLVGVMDVPRPDGSVSKLRPGDIALLAPTGTGLRPYEKALEDLGLSVASQAGKALMRQQETQDVLALLRTIADPFDTLAFGALMRGPLVGFTDRKLLEITEALPPEERPLGLRTDPEQVRDPAAREVLETLASLRRRAGTVTPAALLTEAIERLELRVVLALRVGDRRARALANLGALQHLARPYAVRGLRAFVTFLQAAWEASDQVLEGRCDEDDDAVWLVTIHSSKGLEWPVVIPINTSTGLRDGDRFVHRRTDNTLHWTMGGLDPPDLPIVRAQHSASASLERERLLYVACTRARELLVLSKLPPLDRDTWSRVVDLHHEKLPKIDADRLTIPQPGRPAAGTNDQDADRFAEEAERVAAAAPPITWRRPSDADPDRQTTFEAVGAGETDGTEVIEVSGAGRLRGILIHKLLEEIVAGDMEDADEVVRERARTLLGQLVSKAAPEAVLPDADECARTALSTLALPEIAKLRPRLRAEVAAYGVAEDGALISARADAVAAHGDNIDVVIDWKSDVAPDASERAQHARQLGDYLKLFGTDRGALVYVTRGEVVWLNAAGS